jgi:hypothetical protein
MPEIPVPTVPIKKQPYVLFLLYCFFNPNVAVLFCPLVTGLETLSIKPLSKLLRQIKAPS